MWKQGKISTTGKCFREKTNTICGNTTICGAAQKCGTGTILDVPDILDILDDPSIQLAGLIETLAAFVN